MSQTARASWRGLAYLAVCLGVVLALAGLLVPAATHASGNTLRIEPSTNSVNKDATLDVRVVQNAEVTTSGAQATVTFDPALLQIVSVARGTPYADAPIFSGAGQAAIGAANTTGRLSTVAAAFLPPDSVAAGDQGFLVISFKAVGCGRAEVGLPTGPSDASLLDGRADTYGAALAVTTIGAVVTVCDTMRIEPPNSAVAKDAAFSVKVVQRAGVAISGAQATITFDPALLQITSVTRATPYASAPIFTGAGAAAIGAANTTGRLSTVAAAFVPPGSVPAGDQAFLVIGFKAMACGEATLGMPSGPADASLIDGRTATYGTALPVSTIGGLVTICNTLRIEPPALEVARDATFSVNVVQNTEVATSGAQATITFDPALVRIVSVSRATPYAAAPIFTGAGQAAIGAANTRGKLATVASSFLPPGSVAAGDREFLVIGFKAIGCGQLALGLPVGPADAALVDGRSGSYGNAIAVTTVGGRVTTCSSNPTPTPRPTARPTPTPTVRPTPTPRAVIPLPPPQQPPPPGSVAGETFAPGASSDPFAGTSPDPNAQPSPDAFSSTTPDASSSPPPALAGYVCSRCAEPTTRDRFATIGLAALAVLAISVLLVIVLAVVAGSVAAAALVIRSLRRSGRLMW